MPAGRPTKYSPELLEKCWEYLDRYEEVGDVIPSQVGLQVYVGISNATLNLWKNQEGKKEFSSILDEITCKQQQCLLNGGLSGDFNSTIAKLILTKHGYSDKVETENTHSHSGLPQTIQIEVVTPEKN